MTDSHLPLSSEDLRLSPGHLFRRLPALAGGLGILMLLLSAFLASGENRQFFFSYLTAFVYFLTLALGGLVFVLIQFATRAGWSVLVRRLAENVAGTLPLFAALFVPLFFGIHDLYEWSHSEAVAADHLLEHKQPYLNTSFFVVRAVLFLAVWTILGWWFRHQSISQDSSGDLAITRRLQMASAPAIILFAFTLTFALFDWVMSLDPHWYSTIFGVYGFAGSFMSALALLILLTILLSSDDRFAELVTTEHLHDLGKLLFGFVVFWGYIAFSQFMLIWYGNIPEETLWYAHRLEHGWRAVSILLVVGHFSIPFLFLLSRDVKRSTLMIATASLWLLAMHYVDIYWLVMPMFQGHTLQPHLLDLTTFLGVGGLFVGLLTWLIGRPALVPVQDPRLAESLSFENI